MQIAFYSLSKVTKVISILGLNSTRRSFTRNYSVPQITESSEGKAQSEAAITPIILQLIILLHPVGHSCPS